MEIIKHSEAVVANPKEICELCKLSDDCPIKYGEKLTLKHHKLTVHYFCLLMSSGVYQRGEENEGIYGFLVEDIKREIRRSSRLKCVVCKKKGASVGCCVKSCRRMVHLPCGIQQQFTFQFTDKFPSFCKDHAPKQVLPSSCLPCGPVSCSVCLEPIEPVLSYTILKCPCCHSSWFHRECVQNQAQSAAMFFFRCTICNNKDKFQQEMLRMGIHIPERDASWELEENAYGELLEVYEHCDVSKCNCHSGRSYSARTGKWEIVLCKFCGSRGTHRQCSALGPCDNNWICSDCEPALSGTGILHRINSPSPGTHVVKKRQKRRRSSLHSPIVCKRSAFEINSPEEILRNLAKQISPHKLTLVEVKQDGVLKAAQMILRQQDFDPHHALAVSFKPEIETQSGDVRRFLRLLMQSLQKSTIFEGPENEKNLVLNSQALREDLYFDVGCLLALSLVHGGPPPSFFSKALYKCLFNFPRDAILTVQDMGQTPIAARFMKISDAQSLEALKEAIKPASDYLDAAGCLREVDKLSDKQLLVEDIVNFYLITRMQLPLHRIREGLKTLGIFEQIQMYPHVFYKLFCCPAEKMSASNMAELFSVQFSENEEKKEKERTAAALWNQYLHDCEEGRCATSLEDVLIFATSADAVPALGFKPAPSISFLHSQSIVGVFPKRHPSHNHIVLPVVSTYDVFKKHMEYAICQLTVVQRL